MPFDRLKKLIQRVAPGETTPAPKPKSPADWHLGERGQLKWVPGDEASVFPESGRPFDVTPTLDNKFRPLKAPIVLKHGQRGQVTAVGEAWLIFWPDGHDQGYVVAKEDLLPIKGEAERHLADPSVEPGVGAGPGDGGTVVRVGGRELGFDLARSGYQRYRGSYLDPQTGKTRKIWVGGEQRLDGGSYGAGKRQRRKTIWVIKIDGKEEGEAETLREAKDLVTQILGIAPASIDGEEGDEHADGQGDAEPVGGVLLAGEPGGILGGYPEPAAVVRVGQRTGPGSGPGPFGRPQPAAPGPRQPKAPAPKQVAPAPTKPQAPPAGAATAPRALPEEVPFAWEPGPFEKGKTPRTAPVYDPTTRTVRTWGDFEKDPSQLRIPSDTFDEASVDADYERLIEQARTRGAPEQYKRDPSGLGLAPVELEKGAPTRPRTKRAPVDPNVESKGYQNIVAVLKKATPEELDYWQHWYGYGHLEAVSLARAHNRSVDLVAGVIAVLSPKELWQTNLYLADRALAQDWANVKTLDDNRRKAYSLVVNGDFSAVAGGKVFEFFLSLADPVAFQSRVVVDTHAINIWRGQREGKAPSLNQGDRKMIAADYAKAGAAFGLSPQAVQAITWVLWRQYPTLEGTAPIESDVSPDEAESTWGKGKIPKPYVPADEESARQDLPESEFTPPLERLDYAGGRSAARPLNSAQQAARVVIDKAIEGTPADALALVAELRLGDAELNALGTYIIGYAKKLPNDETRRKLRHVARPLAGHWSPPSQSAMDGGFWGWHFTPKWPLFGSDAPFNIGIRRTPQKDFVWWVHNRTLGPMADSTQTEPGELAHAATFDEAVQAAFAALPPWRPPPDAAEVAARRPREASLRMRRAAGGVLRVGRPFAAADQPSFFEAPAPGIGTASDLWNPTQAQVDLGVEARGGGAVFEWVPLGELDFPKLGGDLKLRLGVDPTQLAQAMLAGARMPPAEGQRRGGRVAIIDGAQRVNALVLAAKQRSLPETSLRVPVVVTSAPNDPRTGVRCGAKQWNGKTQAMEELPAEVASKVAEAKRLEADGALRDAMSTFDEAARLAERAGFRTYADKCKGWAHDCWEAQRKEAAVLNRLPAKAKLWEWLLTASGIPVGGLADYHQGDLAYQQWQNQYAKRRGPKPVFNGGELDAINETLGLTGDKRVSGPFEGFERLTRNIHTWTELAESDVLRVLSEVPGFEKLHLPEEVLEKALTPVYDREEENYYRSLEPEPNPDEAVDEGSLSRRELKNLPPDAFDFDFSAGIVRVGRADAAPLVIDKAISTTPREAAEWADRNGLIDRSLYDAVATSAQMTQRDQADHDQALYATLGELLNILWGMLREDSRSAFPAPFTLEFWVRSWKDETWRHQRYEEPDWQFGPESTDEDIQRLSRRLFHFEPTDDPRIWQQGQLGAFLQARLQGLTRAQAVEVQRLLGRMPKFAGAPRENAAVFVDRLMDAQGDTAALGDLTRYLPDWTSQDAAVRMLHELLDTHRQRDEEESGGSIVLPEPDDTSAVEAMLYDVREALGAEWLVDLDLKNLRVTWESPDGRTLQVPWTARTLGEGPVSGVGQLTISIGEGPELSGIEETGTPAVFFDEDRLGEAVVKAMYRPEAFQAYQNTSLAAPADPAACAACQGSGEDRYGRCRMCSGSGLEVAPEREYWDDSGPDGWAHDANLRTARVRAEDEPGSKVGVFIPIPGDIAAQFPTEGRAGEDSSAPHFTVLYIGKVPEERKAELLERVAAEVTATRPIRLELADGVRDFENDKGQTIYHVTTTDEGAAWMADLNGRLRSSLEGAGFTVKHYKDDSGFKTHATLAYAAPGEEYDGPVPEGSFEVSGVELWGYPEDYAFDFEEACSTMHARKAMPMPRALPEGWELKEEPPPSAGLRGWYIVDDRGQEVARLHIRHWGNEQWSVTHAKTSISGWGAFLYEHALRWVSARDGTLEADQEVSDAAANVWNKYHERADVEHLPTMVESPRVRLEDHVPRTEPALRQRYRMKPKGTVRVGQDRGWSEERTEPVLEDPIPEPKRAPIRWPALRNAPFPLVDPSGLSKGEGLANILRVLTQADDAEVDYWGRWYWRASDNVNEIAQAYGVPFETAAAVVAVLSPGNKWKSNLRAAEEVMWVWSQGAMEPPRTNAYPANIAKAWDLLEGRRRPGPFRKKDVPEHAHGMVSPEGALGGKKVNTFFRSLVDPVAVAREVVLDGHAINLWRGEKRGLKGTRQPNKEERAAMEADYARAADMFGLTPQGVQAITWFLWKNTRNAARVAAFGPLGQQLEALRSQLAKAAQAEVDAWQPDPEEGDPEVGFGGICDRIQAALWGVLSGLDADITEGGQPGDDHAYLVVSNAQEAYEVDVPPSVYETGGGYLWQKLEGAHVGANDVVIAPIPRHWIESHRIVRVGYRTIDLGSGGGDDDSSGPARNKNRDRFVGETYWRPKGGGFARTKSRDVQGDAEEIRLDPTARVLREGDEDWIRVRDAAGTKGGDVDLDAVMKAAFEKGYDAVRVKDRMALLNEGAIVEKTPRGPRPGWLRSASKDLGASLRVGRREVRA